MHLPRQLFQPLSLWRGQEKRALKAFIGPQYSLSST